MTKTQLSTSMPQDELEEKSNGIHTPILTLAGFFLFIGVLWRNVDIFILNLSETWLNILPSKIFPLLIILGFFWLFRRNLISSVLGLELHETRKHIVIGILVGVFLFLMGDVIASILYWVFIDSSVGLTITVVQPELLWYSSVFFLINAVYEEIMFRGILQNGFREYMSINRAIFSSAAIFGVYHIVWPIYFARNGSLNFTHLFVYIVFSGILGGIFGIYYEKFSKRRTLLGPIVAHWLLNFLNENIKISSAEVISGPDVPLLNPVQMAITLTLVLIAYSIMAFIFNAYRVEDLNGWLSQRFTQLRLSVRKSL